MLPYSVTGKYEALIEKLREAGTSADCGDVASARPILNCFRVDDTGEFAHFDCTLRLKEWKWKGVSGKERINIIVRAQEKIRRADHALLNSNVSVNYFDQQGKLLQAFHFDHDPAQADHPLFHLQVTNRCIPLTDEEALELEFTMPAEAGDKVLRCARVPTCDMTLASVLVCLTADHVGGKIFAEFLESICALQGEMPLPNIGKLSASLGGPIINVRSSHWFRHALTPAN